MNISGTVNNILKKKADALEACSPKSCILVNKLQKDVHENNNYNLRKTENIIRRTRIFKENIELNIDKLHRTGRYGNTKKIQSVTVKFTSHSFKQ